MHLQGALFVVRFARRADEKLHRPAWDEAKDARTVSEELGRLRIVRQPEDATQALNPANQDLLAVQSLGKVARQLLVDSQFRIQRQIQRAHGAVASLVNGHLRRAVGDTGFCRDALDKVVGEGNADTHQHGFDL